MGVKKVILSNGQRRLGDALMLTGLVRDFKFTYPDIKLGVKSAIHQIWKNNPHIEHIDNPDEEWGVGPKTVTFGQRTNGKHIAESFHQCLEDKTDYRLKRKDVRPEIFLSDLEKDTKYVDGPYWVISTDHGENFETKEWIPWRWQKLINSMPHVTFVHVGQSESNEVSLTGTNVINFIDKFNDYDNGLRQLFSLIYNAEGVISLVSGLAHVAGAFNKPCVVIAGGRESCTFEKYEGHRYLENVGALKCNANGACIGDSNGGCFKKRYVAGDKDGKEFETEQELKDFCTRLNGDKRYTAPCLEMIKVSHVEEAMKSYYEGGRLQPPEKIATEIKKKIFKIVTNGRYYGGAEKSVAKLSQMATAKGFDVQVVTRGGILCDELKKNLSGALNTVKITDPCDVLYVYASDMIWDFDKEEFDIFQNVQADKKIMALTYKIGKAGDVEWSKGWDKYMFLCSTLKDQFLEKCPDANTEVLPPMVDVNDFMDLQPDYSQPLHLLRHSSQGDEKYPPIIVDIVKDNPEVHFSFMPAPSFMPDLPNVTKYKYNELTVKEFLSKGNAYWYILPEGYTDQGPRAIVEAMASGLPVIAENRDGAKDRLMNSHCGVPLINHHSEINHIVKNINIEHVHMEESGELNKCLAKKMQPEKWIEGL